MVHVIKNRRLKGPIFVVSLCILKKFLWKYFFPFQSVVAAKENYLNIDKDMQVKKNHTSEKVEDPGKLLLQKIISSNNK